MKKVGRISVLNTSDLKELKKDKTLWALTVDLTLLTFIVEMIRVMSLLSKKNKYDILKAQ